MVTAQSEGGETIAMVVGSFSSVSLTPPLVAFFPSRESKSWARLRDSRFFCVNVLGAAQEVVCRQLASKSTDKFVGVAHRRSALGNPILDGAIAWIDCELHSVTDVGDHEMVLGRVVDLDAGEDGPPLVFFRGGFGMFASAVPDDA